MKTAVGKAALVGAALLPACGGQGSVPAADPSAPAAGRSALITGDDLSPAGTSAAPLVVRGTLQPGVGGGSVVLSTPAGAYVLLGDVPVGAGRPVAAGRSSRSPG